MTALLIIYLIIGLVFSVWPWQYQDEAQDEFWEPTLTLMKISIICILAWPYVLYVGARREN